MTEALLSGIVLGLSAGLAPGPLFALVISHTLRHGIEAGLRVALAPLVTDIPIILLTLWLLQHAPAREALLGGLSLIGAGFLFWLGCQSLRAELDPTVTGRAPRPLRDGILVNLLSPHPYLFWTTVGVPMMLAAREQDPLAPWLFVASFYLLLVGAKLALAVLTARAFRRIAGTPYRLVMALLGLALWAFAAFLLRDGLRLLGI